MEAEQEKGTKELTNSEYLHAVLENLVTSYSYDEVLTALDKFYTP